ncbi:flagellar basal body-associated FliL family protein [Aurantiacibacter suaedae]|uniref:flagellar basal body-associated FliL family protein n=1 Tax=Aurantiacibacter suaedae TaxID=2545755 RepID=UPI0010F9F45E|nr:flagellar basal body-associated FliL family protein [Aurantiacibacter suaedae]
MSKDKKEGDEGAKKGGLIGKIVLPLVMLAAGGGGVFGLMAAGIIGDHAEAKEEKGPKLVEKGEEDPYASGEGEGEGDAAYVPGESGSEYRTAYYDFENEFTSNLRGSPAMVQLGLAASTRRDGRVLMWLKKHETAIRSKLLIELSDTDEMEFSTPVGKERLQQRMVDAINDVLEEEEGFGGVDKVYFRSLIVQ